MANNPGRVKHEAEIDAALARWCLSKDFEEFLLLLEQARVPGGSIYNVEDMMVDEHFQSTRAFRTSRN